MQEQTYQEVQAEMTKAMDRPEESKLAHLREAAVEQLAEVERAILARAVHAKQIHRFWKRQLRTVVRPRHMTKLGHALRFNQKGELVYLMTPREHTRRKTLRRQQKASRRANRV